jgi:aspartate aminotransferase
MFTIKLELNDFAKKHPDIPIYDASQGDGGLSLGGIPREELAEALIRFLPAQRTTMYGTPIGREDVRKAIYENYYKFDPSTELIPDHVVIGDGGRDLLQKWYQVVQQSSGFHGDAVLVSAAPWPSYLQGPYINGMNIIMAPGNPENDFKITPAGLDESIHFASREGRTIKGLIITSPDNPTGNYMEFSEILELIQHALSKGIPFILVDLMYQAVVDPDQQRYDFNELFKALNPEERTRITLMDGLTKKAGASNLRNAHLICGSQDVVQKIKSIATHTVFPNAIGEAAALEVYSRSEPTQHPWVKKVVEPTAESRKIVKSRFKELSYKFICNQGYYTFVNIWNHIGKKIPEDKKLKNEKGERITVIKNVLTLKSYLTTCCGLAVIHGSVFKQPDFIRFSYANSPDYTRASVSRLHESLTDLKA